MFFIYLHESAPRPRQRRPNGAGRQVQRNSDLLIGQAFLTHQQRQPVALGECIDGAPSHCRVLGALERGWLRFDRFLSALLLRQESKVSPPPRILARFVAYQVRRHSEQPRALVVDPLLAEGAQECFLRDLLGPVAITQPPRQIPHQRCVIQPEEPFQLVVAHLLPGLHQFQDLLRRHTLQPGRTHLDRDVPPGHQHLVAE